MHWEKFLNRYSLSIVISFLAVLLFLELTSSLTESQIIDEGVHLASGYSYLKTGDFRLNAEHPPLLKILAGLAVSLLNPKLPLDHPSWSNLDQWTFAGHFLYENRVLADDLLLLGRLPTMVLSLLLALAVYLVTRRYFGKATALLALLFCVFEPNLIAHSRYITTDIGVTLFFFISIYYFGEFLNNPSIKSATIVAVFFTLAQVAKFSAIILIPILLFLGALKCMHSSRKEFTRKVNRKFILSVLFIFIIVSALIIHLSYLGNLTVPAQDADGQALLHKRNELVNSSAEKSFLMTVVSDIVDPAFFSGQIIDRILNSSVPFFHYFRGLVKLCLHDYFGHLNYLLGHYYYYGVWYYFPLAYLAKTPLPFLILSIIAILYLSTKFWRSVKKMTNQIFIQKALWRNQFIKTNLIFRKIVYPLYIYLLGFIKSLLTMPFYYLLFLTPIFIYLLFSMFSSINIGLRHIFPIFPFIFILVAKIISSLIVKKGRTVRMGLLIIILLYIINSLLTYPHYLAHFSYQFGGPDYGYYYLLDSNLDWGQDVKNLSRYLSKNNIGEIYLAFFGITDFAEYNIAARPLPTSDQPQAIDEIDGVVAISVTRLYSEEGQYSWLRSRKPDDKIGYSIFIYDLRKSER